MTRKAITALLCLLMTACSPADKDTQNYDNSPIRPIIPAEGEIYLNQIGFEAAGPKLAMVQSTSKAALKWSLLDNGQIILEGKTKPLGRSPQAQQSLHKIDFSSFNSRGERYSLRVGSYETPSFKIGSNLYTQMKYDALSYFYHNRSQDPIDAAYVGPSHARPAGHPKDIAACISGKDLWGTQWPACDYKLDVSGGWYDAGDFGKYVVNSGISVWALLNSYEHFPAGFTDGRVRSPDAGNGVNDLLDEARTNIEFMLAMQVPAGAYSYVPAPGRQTENTPLTLQRIKAEGLVHHKVHAKYWPGDGVMPHEVKDKRFLYPPSTAASLNLAAIGAYCARVWRKIDDKFSARCLTAAEKAWRAAKAHPAIFAYNNFDGGGGYEDNDHKDEFYWAAQELFLTTGRADYGAAAKTYKSQIPFIDYAAIAEFNHTELLGDLSAQKRQDIIRISDHILADIPLEPLHIPYYSQRYFWGSNSNFVARAIILGHAYKLTKKQKYRGAVVHLMDYLLGRNPLGQSYISGYGHRQFYNPHHRHWAATLRKGAPQVPAGVLSGGPNNDNMSDPIAKTQIGQCAPQTCWTDHYKAWTQNEVTINWNAQLLWMVSFLDATAAP